MKVKSLTIKQSCDENFCYLKLGRSVRWIMDGWIMVIPSDDTHAHNYIHMFNISYSNTIVASIKKSCKCISMYTSPMQLVGT